MVSSATPARVIRITSSTALRWTANSGAATSTRNSAATAWMMRCFIGVSLIGFSCDTASRMRRLSQFTFHILREETQRRCEIAFLQRGHSVRENGHRRGLEIAYAPRMRHRLFVLTVLLAAATANAQWSQFAANPRHTGNADTLAQPLGRVMADFINDPLVPSETEAIHYA